MCRKLHCQSLIPLNIFCLNCAFKLKSCIFSYFACGFRNGLAYCFISVLLSELTSFVRPYLLLSSVIYFWDGLSFISFTWEEVILVHPWKQTYITCWSIEQQNGNLFTWRLFSVVFFPLFVILTLNLSILAAGILSFPCGEEVVILQCLHKVWSLVAFFYHCVYYSL